LLAVELVLVQHLVERIREHAPPLAVDLGHAIRNVRPVPAQRLQLEPYLRVAGREIGLEVTHRRPPLFDA
jgi:hypothetical protein